MQKKLTLVLIVVFVAVTALALHSAEKEKVRRYERIEIRKNLGSGDFMPGKLMQLFKFADELELTNPQLLQLRMVFQKQSAARKKNMLNNKQFKKLNDCNISEDEVRKLASEKAKQLEESIIARFKMQQEIKKIFTPEQLKKLEKMNAKTSAKKGPPMLPFWNKAGKDRKGPPAMRHKMFNRQPDKPGVPRPASRQPKDSPEAVIDEMESILDDVDSGE